MMSDQSRPGMCGLEHIDVIAYALLGDRYPHRPISRQEKLGGQCEFENRTASSKREALQCGVCN